MHRKLLLLFIFAFLIRLIALNQSLWLDEATTANVVKEYSYLGIVTKFSPFDFHPPLFYLLEKLWTNIVGYSEIALRFPSVLFSLLTGGFIYLIGKKIANEKVAFWSTAFFLYNPLVVYYSQEARMYMMASLFLTISIYYLLTSLRFDELKISHLLFGLFISISFLIFYGSIFLIIPMFFYQLNRKRYKLFIVSCFMFCFTCLLLSPLLYQQLFNAEKTFELVINWKNVLGPANLKNLLLVLVKFEFGRISFYPKWFYWFISGTWTVFISLIGLRGGLKNKFLLFLFISPLIIGLIFSFFTPLLQYFRFLFLVPLMCLLLSLAVSNKLLLIEGSIIITGFLILSFVYLFNPNFYREDWKNLAKSLPKNGILYMIKASSDPVKYYRKDINIVDLLSLKTSSPSTREIIVNPYVVDLYGLNYQKILMMEGYQKKDIKMFRGLYDEIWERR